MNTLPVLSGRAVRLRHGVPLLQRIYRRQGAGPGRPPRQPRRTPSTTAITTSPRPSGCCSGITSRPLPAPVRWWVPRWRRNSDSRPDFCGCWSGAVLAGLRAGFHGAGGLGPAPRPLAGRDRAHRNQPVRRPGGHDRRAVHPAGDPGRPGHRGGERAGQQSVGRVHHRGHRSHRPDHGSLDVQEPRRQNHGHRSQHFRRGAADLGGGRGPLVCADGRGRRAHVHPAPDHLPDDGLRLHRLRAAGVAAARAARLPFHLREAGHHRAF